MSHPDGGQKGLGDMQTGPRVEGTVQPMEPGVKGTQVPFRCTQGQGLCPQIYLGGEQQEHEVSEPTGQGYELDGDEQLAMPVSCLWGGKWQGEIKKKNGVVHEYGPWNEGDDVIEVATIGQYEDGLWIPYRYSAKGSDPVGQLVG